MININEVKNIPIEKVFDMYGIKQEKNGMFKLRNEKTASCKLYTQTNSFYDYGSNVGGSPIDLVMYIENVDTYAAMSKLASAFGISNEKNNSNDISDYEYRLIGIYPERASANLNFDLDKYTFQQSANFSEKYSFPFKDLKKQNIGMYKKVLSDRSYSFIIEKRKDFFINCLKALVFLKNFENKWSKDSFEYNLLNDSFKDSKIRLNDELSELNHSIRILNKALEKKVLQPIRSVDDILNSMDKGTFKYQISGISYLTLKNNETNSIVISSQEYLEKLHLLKDVNYSAFFNNKNINIVFLKEEINKIEEIFPNSQLLKKNKSINDLISEAQKKVIYMPVKADNNKSIER